jgi:hypothetical protein
VAATAYWEAHTKKDGEVAVGGVTIRDVKVGQLMTVEGGIGKSFLQGAASVGMAYYAQWKVTEDEFAVSSLTLPAKDKHRVFGLGPDVTIPIATSTKLIALVNLRYLVEMGTQTKTQGQSIVVTTTFPVGGIKIAR